MKTQVAGTPIAQYHELKSVGFKNQHAELLSHMEPGVIYSRRQVGRMAGIETSTTAARFNKLIELGDVVVCGCIKCPITGVTVEAVKLADAQTEFVL